MTTLQFKAKNFFFDRKRVEQILGKESAKAIGKALAFVRTRARSSLRRRKAVSVPGSPPSVHSDHPVATLKNIWFALDRQTLSGIVGPFRLNVHALSRIGAGPGAENVLTQGAVPGTLEHGGMIGVRKIRNSKGEWVRIPFGHRLRPTRFVPVWRATPEEKAGRLRVHTEYRGRRALNFYEVPAERLQSVIIWNHIAPRPFMLPALKAEAPKFPSLWLSSGGAAA